MPQQISLLDRPEILNLLFFPRKESGREPPDGAISMDIPTEGGITIGSRLYIGAPENPHILFFHGNGEIAEDYDDIGSVYVDYGVNFMVMDYRGYGRSGGRPGVAAMLGDAHHLFKGVLNFLSRENRTGPLWVMGRSLGSAPAIELASVYPGQFQGLIVESGFSQTLPLLKRLGIDIHRLGIDDAQLFSNSKRIASFPGPTLIIHAEYDQIIPLSHGRELFSSSTALTKKLYVVPNADHNTILMVSGKTYFETIRDFIYRNGPAQTESQ